MNQTKFIRIDLGFPIPTKRQTLRTSLLREALLKMKPAKGLDTDESFQHESQDFVYHVASKCGVKVRTEKQAGGGWRVWRKS